MKSLDQIPGEIRALRQWVVYRKRPKKGGKFDKVPYYVDGSIRNGAQGTPKDRAAMGTFEQAVELYESGRFDGIGLAMFADAQIVALDLDGCINEDGRRSVLAEEIVSSCHTYVEVSPSGTGLRLFYIGEFDDKKNHKLGIETFHGKGFVTTTGNRINGQKVLPLPSALRERFDVLLGRRSPQKSAPSPDALNQDDLQRLLARLRAAFEFLSVDADDREFWLRCGWAIARDTEQSQEGFELWLKWAQQSKEHDPSRDVKQMRIEYFEKSLEPRDNRVTVASIFHRAYLAGWRERRATTDLGNAERLADAAGETLKFCPEMGKWLFWDGWRWQFDESGAALRVAKTMARGIYAEAQREPDDVRRSALARWAVASESLGRLKASVELARSDTRLLVSVDQLDTDPWLLGVRNGVLDLRSGELWEPSPHRHLTKQAAVAFDPAAVSPLWETFLDQIFENDESLIQYVQRALGYSLTGNTMAKALFFMYGPGGDNGKSTLIETILALLGDYAIKTRAETFMRKRDANDNSASPDRVALRAARLVVASELSDRQHFDETFLKDATGGVDRITARNLYEGSITFKPEFKVWFYGNHKPRLREDDPAAWRRLHLIPFAVRIPIERQDTELGQKLISELPGILNWALKGLTDWQTIKLSPPAKVTEAVRDYQSEMDTIGRFLTERCEVVKDGSIKSEVLYRAYARWSLDGNGQRPMGNNVFSMRLAERGMKYRMLHGSRLWVNVILREGGTDGHLP